MNAPAETLAPQARAMDRMYRFQRHFYDASRRYYLLGRDEMLDRLQPPPGGSVLEIGCGTGRNLLGLAARHPEAQLYGIDISQEMLKSALAALGRGGNPHTARLACADATDFDPRSSLGREAFDRVYLSYTLSMIPDWRAALRHAVRLLAPGGELHIADFGQSEALPAPLRRALFGWLGLFHVTPRSGLRGELAALATQHNATLDFATPYRGYACLAAVRLRTSRP